MSISSIIQIGGEDVDINAPCDVVTALKKRLIAVASGSSELIIRMGGEEVTFSKANVTQLKSLIADYEGQCARANGKGRQGRSRRLRFI
ncbi:MULTISPECIES: hypothetical protein [Roseibium]|uniref:GpW protein n=1 Tax=Roseibium aggregatum (strain ATCC 25650 / DSM 13394 / JCM 20685 / NBRC 16684 / NCIMB 2208 / IAM 12614 / B1) TaxID=384765 RepID=A0NQ82_ROSAI|nr:MULTISPECIES: hypothetical protein [Roseibium]EAV44940.1 hypothetical protein SIAM614_13033 [Stappia aggregata IAM 12614] [Roseibium aggregatum IAM 12614]